ncbi:MAG: SDR family oxidoreductase [Nitrospirota bacterium]
MKLLITGALGHIGSQFLRELKPGEYEEVILLDNLATQRYCSLFNLPQGVPFRFVEADICTDALDGHVAGVDVVVHLAAITDAAGSFEIKDRVERVNYDGVKRVAEACVRGKCRLIFISTTSVYGTQQAVVDEGCSVEELKPQSPYADSKLRAERLLQSMGERDGLRFVICRFGTIYGVSIGMRFHTAINKFVWQACMGQPLTVWKTAMEQKRPYLYLGDAVRALSFIIRNDIFDNRIYNVLTANATVGDIVKILKASVPDVALKLVDAPIMNQLSYTVSNERFKTLGFEFSGSLDQGIKETVELLKNVRPSS